MLDLALVPAGVSADLQVVLVLSGRTHHHALAVWVHVAPVVAP